jgi:hypothetical protein
MALTLAAVLTARRATTWKGALLAAGTMTLAVFAKQTAVFVFAPMGLYLLATKWRVGLPYVAATAGLLGGITLLLNALTHGWYAFFTWELLFQHDIIHDNERLFWTRDMRPFLPVVTMLLFMAPRLLTRERLWMTGFWTATIIGLFAGAYSSRLHSGGAENVLMPAFAAAAIALGICLGLAMQNPRRTLLIAGTSMLCIAQFWALRYDSTTQVPTKADTVAVGQFVTWLEGIPGDVWVVDHPAYAAMAGKPTYGGEGSMEDVLRGKEDAHAKVALENSIATAIHEQRFSAIVLDGPDDARGFPADWKDYYEQMAGTAIPSDEGHPVVNNTGVPRDVWVPIGTQVPMPAA